MCLQEVNAWAYQRTAQLEAKKNFALATKTPPLGPELKIFKIFKNASKGAKSILIGSDTTKKLPRGCIACSELSSRNNHLVMVVIQIQPNVRICSSLTCDGPKIGLFLP